MTKTRAGAKGNKCLFNGESERGRKRNSFQVLSSATANFKTLSGVTFFFSHCYRFLRTVQSSRRILTSLFLSLSLSLSLAIVSLFRVNIFTWARFNWNSLTFLRRIGVKNSKAQESRSPGKNVHVEENINVSIYEERERELQGII